MFQVDDIDIMAINNSNAKSLKGCCKIQVVLLSHDFCQVDWIVNFLIKVIASPILNGCIWRRLGK
jgi:hypothetical protein